MHKWELAPMGSLKEACFDVLREEGFEQTEEELHHIVMTMVGLLEALPCVENDVITEVFDVFYNVQNEDDMHDRFIKVLKQSHMSNRELAEVLDTTLERVKGIKSKKYIPDEWEIDNLLDYYENEYAGYSSMESYLYDCP